MIIIRSINRLETTCCDKTEAIDVERISISISISISVIEIQNIGGWTYTVRPLVAVATGEVVSYTDGCTYNNSRALLN